MLFSRLDPRWMIKTVRLARFIVQTFPLFGFPMFATGSFALSWFVQVTYFPFCWFRWTGLHLCHPNAGGVTIWRRHQFHCTRFEACGTAGCGFRWFCLFGFPDGFALFRVVLAARTGTVDGGSPLLFRGAVFVVIRGMVVAGVVVVHVVVVVKVGVTTVDVFVLRKNFSKNSIILEFLVSIQKLLYWQFLVLK